MDRRDFIRGTGGLLAAAAVHGKAALAGEGGAQDTVRGRSVLAMNRNWRYHPGRLEGASAPGFDDSGFSRVVIPHTNVRLPWHSSTIRNTSSSPRIGGDFGCRQARGASACLSTLKAR